MRYLNTFERQARREGLEQGLRLGREEGREDGLRKGQAALILRLLELRFGQLMPEQRALLADAELGQLSRWGERVVTAASLDEVFAEE